MYRVFVHLANHLSMSGGPGKVIASRSGTWVSKGVIGEIFFLKSVPTCVSYIITNRRRAKPIRRFGIWIEIQFSLRTFSLRSS